MITTRSGPYWEWLSTADRVKPTAHPCVLGRPARVATTERLSRNPRLATGGSVSGVPARRRTRTCPSVGSRVLLILLTVAFAYVLARAVAADEPSTVSVVIRAIGLAACLFWLVESLIKGRTQHRHDPVHRDVAGR